MPPRPVASSFWRGGTSRGLIFRAQALAPFSPAARDNIILTALGSPDPNGRQIDGLGGGVSSLSKAMIIGLPGEGLEEQRTYGRLPGPEWADDGHLDGLGSWDLVYRFCQVPIKSDDLDWSATCGNMLSAVALHALSTPIIPYTTIFSRARSLAQPSSDEPAPIMFPLSIMSASNSAIMKARVPLHPWTLQPWEPPAGQGAQIAGVPGTAAGIEVELPMETGEGGGNGLVTGRPTDEVEIDGHKIPVTIATSGLPNIFVTLEALGFDSSLITAPSAQLTAHHELNARVERLRRAASATAGLNCSLSSPKVTLVGTVPTEGYSTSAGGHVTAQDVDLCARAISSGDWHATIPGTSLGALNVAWGTPGTVVNELGAHLARQSEDDVVTVRAGHAAGAVSSSVRFEGQGSERRPVSVVMFLESERELEQKELQAALSRIVDEEWCTSRKWNHFDSSTPPSPQVPPSDVEIEDKFLDPASLEGRAIRLQGLTHSLSQLGRRIALELPETLLSAATSFHETVSPTGVLTIEIRHQGELIGSCSTRLAEDDDLESTSDDEDMDVIVEDAEVEATEGQVATSTSTHSAESTRPISARSPLHRASGVQVELHRQLNPAPALGSTSRLGAGWADHARAAAAASHQDASSQASAVAAM